MKELHLTIVVRVGLLCVAEILDLSFVSAVALLPNRCPKKVPYPFENQTLCCSRPVDTQWRKLGYCYGRTQKCPHTEGCIDYHPLCSDIESLLGIDFPLEEYNKLYKPTLIPTREFSHKYLFNESSNNETSEIHCIWRDDTLKWIMGLCENVETSIGQYFLDADSECPVSDKGWKEIENGESVVGIIKDTSQRISGGVRLNRKSPTAGIKFQRLKRKRPRIQKCEKWEKIPLINVFKCKKFFPKTKKNPITKDLISALKEDGIEVPDNSADTQKENRMPPLITRNQESDENIIDEFDYSIDSILYDI